MQVINGHDERSYIIVQVTYVWTEVEVVPQPTPDDEVWNIRYGRGLVYCNDLHTQCAFGPGSSVVLCCENDELLPVPVVRSIEIHGVIWLDDHSYMCVAIRVIEVGTVGIAEVVVQIECFALDITLIHDLVREGSQSPWHVVVGD